MIASLARYVRKNVSPEEYYKSIFPEISWASGSDETKVLSPFVDEKVPSLSINRDTGAWYSFCASDEKGGNSIISFESAYEECNNREAAQNIFYKFIHPTISEEQIRRGVRKLWKTPTVLKYLRKRLLSKKIIRHYKLGWNGNRIMIPIHNEFGLCVNIRLYDPKAKGSIPKMLNYTSQKESRSYGSPTMLYPIENLLELSSEESIYICEGEWDTLAMLSIDLPAISSTAGAGTWPSNYNSLFQAKNIVIVYDNDQPGITGTKRIYRQLLRIARSIKQLKIPKKYGKDVTDYMTNNSQMREKKSWQSLTNKTKALRDNPEILITPQKEAIQVSLDQASQADWYGQRIQVEALITGKDHAPYLLPQKFRISCDDSCEDCPIALKNEGFKDYKLEMSNILILRMLDATYETNRRRLLQIAGIKNTKGCKARIENLKTFNVEHLLLIPTLDSKSKEYVMRSAYYVGHGLRANKAYRFEGMIAMSPKDQHVVYLFDSAKPVQDEIETFELNKSLRKKLLRFRPKNISYLAKLQSIADWQSRNITKILDRPDLHIAVDLAFHSVYSFWFNKEFIPRAMLDILILGDTRCGKGYVTEKLSKYYKLGEIASGDNCSFAGLVGGLQQTGNNWRITWGLIPLNHRRLVIIDEASSLDPKEIGRLSRIRSEGVAEIVKIIRETTLANTRLIWLANPRSGRPMSTYNTGIEAVKELVGAIEDISRFDFVLTVASSEVSSEVINAPALYSTDDQDKFPFELSQALILWAWSRSPSQINFTNKATKSIIEKAVEFGHTYSSVIPLVQAENIRIKLAKVSAAVAARVFSSDKSFEKLIITSQHVKCAVILLKSFYDKPSMAYNLFSQTTIATSKIIKPHIVNKTIESFSTNKSITITGLLEMQHINANNLADYVGDFSTAKSLIGELVQHRCLTQLEGTNWYIKNADFTKQLRKKQKELKKNKGE